MTLSVKPYAGVGAQTIQTGDEVVTALGLVVTALNATNTALGLNNTKTDATNTKLDSLIADTTPAAVTPYGRKYKACPASTATTLGSPAAVGEDIDHIVVTPSSTTLGAITIKDGTDTAITVQAAATLSNLVMFTIPLGLKSRTGGWVVTFGAGATGVTRGNWA